MLKTLKKTNHLTAEENALAAFLADAVIDFAKKNLQDLRRGITPFQAEPAPTGCVWIGDRCILPTTNQPITEGQQA